MVAHLCGGDSDIGSGEDDAGTEGNGKEASEYRIGQDLALDRGARVNDHGD